MRVCFKVRDFPDPIVKEFDSLVYNQVTNEARFYNYGNQGKDGSLYVSFQNEENQKPDKFNWGSYYKSLSYAWLRNYIMENGYVDFTQDLLFLRNINGEIISTVTNDARIDSRSINMKFIEEH